jgi:hypothetical protein
MIVRTHVGLRYLDDWVAYRMGSLCVGIEISLSVHNVICKSTYAWPGKDLAWVRLKFPANWSSLCLCKTITIQNYTWTNPDSLPNLVIVMQWTGIADLGITEFPDLSVGWQTDPGFSVSWDQLSRVLCTYSPESRKWSSFRNISFQKTRQWIEFRNAVIPSVIHHLQKPFESTNRFDLH